MFIIGVDPHKASHTAAVLDHHEQLVGEFEPDICLLEELLGRKLQAWRK